MTFLHKISFSFHVIWSELVWDCMAWTVSEIFLLLICQTHLPLFFFLKGGKKGMKKKGGWEGMNKRLNLGVIFLLLHDVKHVWEMFSSSEVICPMQRTLEMKITFQIKIECLVFLFTDRET